MSGIDILTHSSFGEGFSNVIGEAMASGTPCVVSDVGDSGIVIRPADPAELFNAWRSLLQLEERGFKRLREKARDRIIELFDIKSIVNRFEDLYIGMFNQ